MSATSWRYTYQVLRLNNYKTIGVVPADYNNRILYHLLIASKARGFMRWIKEYMECLEEKAPRDYDTLKIRSFR